MRFAKYRSHRAIEDLHKSFGVLLIGITTHGWFVDRDLFAACLDQCFQFGAYNRDQCFSDGIAIGISLVGIQSAAQCIGTRYTGFERKTIWCQSLETLILLYDAKSAWGRNLIYDIMFPALIVCRRTKYA